MTILFFVQHLGLGGVTRQVSLTSDRLVGRGHRASLLGLYSLDEGWRTLWTSRAVALGTLLGAPPKHWVFGLARLVSPALRLRRLVRDERVDVVYAYQGAVARLLAWAVTRRSRATVVWGTQGSGSHSIRERGWTIGLPHRMCIWVSRFVPLLIANSEAGHARRREEGFRCRTMIVVDNPLDPELFKRDRDARQRIRDEWGVRDECLVGLVGRFDPVKDHQTFLSAAADLSARDPNVRFVVVGEGPSAVRRRLEQRASDLGVAHRVLWTGLRTDMPSVYAALDVLCSCSMREGAPNVLGEAMACGVPCVVTDVGDSARIVGEDGIVVPPGDPSALAQGLETMLARLDTLDREALRARIVRMFDAERAVAETERALAAVAPVS